MPNPAPGGAQEPKEDSASFQELLISLNGMHERLHVAKTALDARVATLEAENDALRRKPGRGLPPVRLPPRGAGREELAQAAAQLPSEGSKELVERGEVQVRHRSRVSTRQIPGVPRNGFQSVYLSDGTANAGSAIDLTEMTPRQSEPSPRQSDALLSLAKDKGFTIQFSPSSRFSTLSSITSTPSRQQSTGGNLQSELFTNAGRGHNPRHSGTVIPLVLREHPDEGFPEVWPVWKEDVSKERLAQKNRFTDQRMNTRMMTVEFNTLTKRVTRAGDEIRGDGPLQALVLQPSSKWRLVWDVLSFMVMGWDLFFLPLQAFTQGESMFWRVADVTTSSFWTLDIFNSFFVGFHTQGLIEMRPSRIAARYFRTWFPMDIVIVSVDWILNFQFLSGMDFLNLIRAGKALRIVRVLRMIRLLRLVKLMWLVTELTDNIQSESLLTVLGIAKLTVGIAVVNHFIACSWYALGSLGSGSNTWIVQHSAAYVDREGEPASLGYLYATSLHWSLSQFTPASMEVGPSNSVERVFSICVIIFALVTFSSFVSSITTSMTHLRNINTDHIKQQEQVRRYITDNKVPLALSNHIFEFVRSNRSGQKTRVHSCDVTAFKVMPETLRMRLHVHVFLPVLLPHPFFKYYCEFDENGPRNICHGAMMEHTLPTKQELFTYGDPASKMWFLLSGACAYSVGTSAEDSMDSTLVRLKDVSKTDIVPGQTMCDMALWLQWENRGRVVATSGSELISLDAFGFHEAVRKTTCFDKLQAYARLYAERLLRDYRESDINDLWGNLQEISEMAQTIFPSPAMPLAPPPRPQNRRMSISAGFRQSMRRASASD